MCVSTRRGFGQFYHCTHALLCYYEQQRYPSRKRMAHIATRLGLRDSQVKNWFINRRKRQRATHRRRKAGTRVPLKDATWWP